MEVEVGGLGEDEAAPVWAATGVLLAEEPLASSKLDGLANCCLDVGLDLPMEPRGRGLGEDGDTGIPVT